METDEIRVKIPAELRELGSISKVNWQLLFGKVLKEKFERLERIKKIVDRSELTKKDAEELADEVNLSLAKRYEKSLDGE